MAHSVHEQTNVESGREGQGEGRSRAAHSIPCIAGTRLGKEFPTSTENKVLGIHKTMPHITISLS